MFAQVGLLFASLVVLASAEPVSDESVVRKEGRGKYASDSVITLPRVRRSNYYSGERQSETLFEDRAYPASQSGEHCVVWGDWTFTGRWFNSDDEAAEHFKHMRRTELAAIHMHRSHEVSRFMSKRLVSVRWEKMKDWCAKHSGDAVGSSLTEKEQESPSPRRVEVRVGRNGAISDASEGERSIFDEPQVPEPSQTRHRHHSLHQSSHQSSHLSAPAPVPAFAEHRRHQRSRFSPLTSSLATEGAQTASTLSGKVSLLEQEATQLSSKALDLFKSVGINGANIGPASALQPGPFGENHGKLKNRLLVLEEFTASIQAKTNALETEFFGTTTADKLTNVRKDSANSFKAKIEAVSVKIEELKGKMSALQSTPLLGEVAKLEQKAAHLGDKAGSIFSVIGVESATAPVKPVQSSVLKERLNSLEQYADEMQRSAASLEYDILGNSWNFPAASGDSLKGGCIKDHAGSLGGKLNDLESRLSTLASAPIVTDVSKMEDAVTSLALRAAALSKNVGISGKISGSDFTAPKTATLKARVTLLESGMEKMQSATSSLEEELAGNVGTMPAHSQKDTLKSKAKFLELQVENLNGRISALEQQV